MSLASGTTTKVYVARHLRIALRLGVEKYLIILIVFKVVTTVFCLLDVSAELIQRAAVALLQRHRIEKVNWHFCQAKCLSQIYVLLQISAASSRNCRENPRIATAA